MLIVLFSTPCGNGIRLTIKRGLCSSFFVALSGAMAGPGMALTTDNGRADYGRGGPGFQIFPFMAIFSTNSTIYQSIRSFPKLTLYGTQSYVKWGGPVQRSLNLKSPICGGAVLEVHNRRLRKLDLVMQKFFIKKIFFYHIFPFQYKKILNFACVSRSGKKFFYLSTGKILHFFTIYWKGAWTLLSLVFISRASTLPYSRSRTYLSYNTTDGEGGG